MNYLDHLKAEEGVIEAFVEESRADYYAKSVLLQKAFAFGLEIIDLTCRLRSANHYELSSQILRSGTSIGAMANEASAAESKRDFAHKIAIAAKEAREVHYWLLLVDASDSIDEDVSELLPQAEELIRITTAIVKTCRSSTT